MGFSWCWRLLLWGIGSRVQAQQLLHIWNLPEPVRRWVLNHWTTREVLGGNFLEEIMYKLRHGRWEGTKHSRQRKLSVLTQERQGWGLVGTVWKCPGPGKRWRVGGGAFGEEIRGHIPKVLRCTLTRGYIFRATESHWRVEKEQQSHLIYTWRWFIGSSAGEWTGVGQEGKEAPISRGGGAHFATSRWWCYMCVV